MVSQTFVKNKYVRIELQNYAVIETLENLHEAAVSETLPAWIDPLSWVFMLLGMVSAAVLPSTSRGVRHSP